MYRTVMVPLDGSPFGEHALPLALAVARRAKAELQLVQVHVPLLYLDSATAFEATLDEKARAQEQAYLDGVAKRVAEASSVPVKPILLSGPVTETLQEHISAGDISLIVMTTHGRGPLSRFWLGSVADDLVRRTPRPLLLVRPRDGIPDLSREQVLQHMLIPLDGSPLAEKILEPALALGKLMEADFTLLRVIKPMTPLPSEGFGYGIGGTGRTMMQELHELQEQVEADAREYLDKVAGRLRKEGHMVQTQLVTADQPASGILDAVSSGGCDGIALETHGRRGLARLVLGSVADKVVRGATVPVLVHRPAGK